MQRKTKCNLFSCILCMMLIVAMALCTVGCNKVEKEIPQSGQETEGTAPVSDTETSGADAETAEVTELGEGAVSFDFFVVDKGGNETKFLIHTDKEIVGEALQELGLIEGEEEEYGLYVKKVNGITADYDVDKTYWAFYINGEYAMSGVDVTAITEGDAYLFKVE